MTKKKEVKTESPFQTDGEMKNVTGLPFHNFEKDGELSGVYLGLGKRLETEKSEGSFDNLVFLKTSGELVQVPKFALFDKMVEEAAHGEYLYKIASKGIRQGEKRAYHDLQIQRAKLVTPLVIGTDYSPSDWL